MSEEKTIEELKSELEKLRKENIEVELQREKEKQTRRQQEIAQKEREELEKQITEKIKKDLGYNKESKIETQPEQQSMNLSGDKKFNEFREDFINRHKLQVLSYEDLVKKIAYRGFRQ